MDKKIAMVTSFILCLCSLAFAGEEQTQKLSNATVQALEKKGIMVQGLHKSVRPPVRGEKQKSDPPQIIEIEVSLDLHKSSIKPVYMGTSMRAKTSSSAPSDTILVEDFEGEFPGNTWQVTGNPTWGKTDTKLSRNRSNKVWCAAGGDSAKTPGGAYPNNLQAMMVYGPFDLSEVNYGELKFSHWLDTARGKDWFFYMLSTDGTNFSGVGISGQTGFYSGVWREERLPLSNFPDLGDVTGSTQVWLAFLFQSDSVSTSDTGVYIDNITLMKRTISGTPIAGAISGALIPEKNPYIAPLVTGVVEGDSLEIKPGVEIRFESKAEFVVSGYLKAVGTLSDSILFTSNTQPGAPGQWNGVSFASSTQEGSAIQFARIEYSDDGIFSDSPKVPIKNNLLTSNKRGVFCASDVTVLDNKIIDNGTGIYAYFASPILRRNLIKNNNFGISTAISLTLIIEENQIIGNTRDGISYHTARPKIVGNLIKDNGGNGIVGAITGLTVYGQQVIAGNEIVGNAGNGIQLGGLAIYGSITQNFIKGNMDGIHIIPGFFGAEPSMVIYNNTIIANNENGMNFRQGDIASTHIINNILTQNAKAAIYSTGENISVDISHNNVFDNSTNYSVNNQDSLGILAATNMSGDSIDIYFNISGNPLFVDPNTGDYGLQYVENGFPVDSPCRTSGNPNVFYNDVDGSLNDMGHLGGSRIFITRTRLDFGNIVAGLKKELKLWVHNDRDSSFFISSLELSDPNSFLIAPDSLAEIKARDRASLAVTFMPPQPGKFQSELQIMSSDFYGDSVAIVNLYGTGLNGTLLHGEIKGILRKENNPYIVTENITIPKGDSLKIMPGTVVLFNGQYTFSVHGNLQAVGAPNDSIIFARYELSQENWKGIRFIEDSSNSRLEYCLIERVHAQINNYGGGIYCKKSSPSIKNNTIRYCAGYWGGAICVRAKSNPIISNNVIINNRSWEVGGTGIYILDSSPIVSNNIITDNFHRRSPWGFSCGGIQIRGSTSTPIIVNNTIYNNERGGVLFERGVSLEIKNNIIWKNSIAQIRIDKATPMITYCNIEGGWEGEGNIDADPLFVDSENGDFRLQLNSPAIDAGNPDSLFNDPEDPNNTGFALFPAQGTIRNDMGALGGPYALLGAPIVTDVSTDYILSQPVTYQLFQNYPNPFNPETTISYQLPEAANVKLEIFNLLGQHVATLVEKKQPAGYYAAQWDGRDELGQYVASGVYLYRIRAGGFVQTRKLSLVR